MATRVTTAVAGLVSAHPGQTVVAVSHADPIKVALAGAAGVPLDLFQRLVVAPCSVSAVLFGADGPFVLAVNSTAALTELALS
jgi:probable phosphoglycerate mutase